MSYYNLKAEIIKRNLSYRDQAIQLNISEEALIEKINKKKNFQLHEIEKLQQVFPNVKLEFLFK